MFVVIDINTGEVVGKFRNPLRAAECRDELNETHLDKLYAMREQDPDDVDADEDRK